MDDVNHFSRDHKLADIMCRLQIHIVPNGSTVEDVWLLVIRPAGVRVSMEGTNHVLAAEATTRMGRYFDACLLTLRPAHNAQRTIRVAQYEPALLMAPKDARVRVVPHLSQHAAN